MPNCEDNTCQPDSRKDVEDRFVFVDPCRPSRRRRRDRRCAECKTSKTPTWRRNSNGSRLCNGCGLRAFRDKKKSETISPNLPIGSATLPGDADSSALVISTGILSGPGSSRLVGVSAGSCQSAIESGQAGQNASSEIFQIQLPPVAASSALGVPHDNLAQKCLVDAIPNFLTTESSGYLRSVAYPRGLGDVNPNPLSIYKHLSSNSRITDDDYLGNSHSVSWLPYNAIQEFINGKSSAQISGTYQCNGEGHCQNRCPRCLQRLFSAEYPAFSRNLQIGSHDWLALFQRRTIEVHCSALQEGSSVYVATESFIFQCAGETLKLTAFAVLREQYDVVPSPFTSHSLFSASEAARSDLEFDSICVPTIGYPQADRIEDWLDRQSLVKLIEIPRAKSALWDLGRLPAGSHHPDSTTFRYLRRSFLPIETSSGERTTTPQILSGSPIHNFRCVHQVTMLLKHVRSEKRKEIFGRLESMLREACIRSCQMWFIACLDGALDRYGLERADFLEANMAYMRDTIVLYREAFRQINVDQVPHICLPEPCPSHVQPTFDWLVHSSQHALEALFSPASVSSYVQSRLPTSDQLLNAEIVGYVQYKLCFSCHLLSEGQRQQHNDVMWKRFAEERNKLLLRTNSNLIWNYLPTEVIKMAEGKLDRAWASLNLPSRLFLTA